MPTPIQTVNPLQGIDVSGMLNQAIWHMLGAPLFLGIPAYVWLIVFAVLKAVGPSFLKSSRSRRRNARGPRTSGRPLPWADRPARVAIPRTGPGAMALPAMGLLALMSSCNGARLPDRQMDVLNLMIAWGAIILGAFLIAHADKKLWRPFRLGNAGERRVRQTVEKAGYSALHDVVIAGERGPTQIDHIIRLPSGLVVLETKAYSGFVHGFADQPSWNQRCGAHIFNVPNPCNQNFGHLKAIEAVVHDRWVPIRGLVVAAGSARFSGPLQGVVTRLRDLPAVLASASGEPAVPQSAMDGAWRRLAAAAEGGRKLRAAHQAEILKRRTPDELFDRRFAMACAPAGAFLILAGAVVFA